MHSLDLDMDLDLKIAIGVKAEEVDVVDSKVGGTGDGHSNLEDSEKRTDPEVK